MKSGQRREALNSLLLESTRAQEAALDAAKIDQKRELEALQLSLLNKGQSSNKSELHYFITFF